MKEILTPEYRYLLRAKVSEAGFRTLNDYAIKAGLNISKISRVICGWEIPSQEIAMRMAAPLDIALDDFIKLL